MRDVIAELRSLAADCAELSHNKLQYLIFRASKARGTLCHGHLIALSAMVGELTGRNALTVLANF
jgi:hypothetical protein